MKDSSPAVNLLLSCSPVAVPEPRKLFSGAVKLDISPPREDIYKFIDGYMERLLPDAIIHCNDDLGEDVKDTVAQSVMGM